jgi:hypothetical protein
MCNSCRNLIYDIIINPVSLDSPLYGKINYTRLKDNAAELTNSFYRSVKDFPVYPEFFVKHKIIDIETSILRIRIPNEQANKLEYLQYIWDKFHDEYPIYAAELEYANDICIENSIIKKLLIKQFLMDKLYIILSTIPVVHKEHSEHNSHKYAGSPGPACIWKIINIRNNANLPVSKYLDKLEELDDFSLYN